MERLVSDNGTTIVVAVIGLLGLLIQSATAVALAMLARRFTQRLDGIADVGERTEKYCNSALGSALQVAAEAKEMLARNTGDKGDVDAAKVAALASAAHKEKQALIDATDTKALKSKA
jgi:hypothetical protein